MRTENETRRHGSKGSIRTKQSPKSYDKHSSTRITHMHRSPRLPWLTRLGENAEPLRHRGVATSKSDMDGDTVPLEKCGARPLAAIWVEASVFLSANRAAIGNEKKEDSS